MQGFHDTQMKDLIVDAIVGDYQKAASSRHNTRIICSSLKVTKIRKEVQEESIRRHKAAVNKRMKK